MPRHSLDAVFKPRAVAVIGASRRPSSIGREVIRNLITFEYTGKVFPVNPKADVVASMKCYRRVADVPDDVDLAVIVVPRDQVPGVLEACGRKGIKGVVTITAGFKEVGPDGAALERRLASILARHGMRMVGPNCMGVVNTHPDFRLNATFAAETPERGKAAFVSQSGALGEAILANARSLGLGISMFVSMGNKTDVSGNDLLEYWEHDPDVRLILMYLESFDEPGRFAQLARRISRRKPILTVKAGRSEAGARAASSHTGVHRGARRGGRVPARAERGAACVDDGGAVHARHLVRPAARSPRSPHRGRHQRRGSGNPRDRRLRRAGPRAARPGSAHARGAAQDPSSRGEPRQSRRPDRQRDTRALRGVAAARARRPRDRRRDRDLRLAGDRRTPRRWRARSSARPAARARRWSRASWARKGPRAARSSARPGSPSTASPRRRPSRWAR